MSLVVCSSLIKFFLLPRMSVQTHHLTRPSFFPSKKVEILNFYFNFFVLKLSNYVKIPKDFVRIKY